MKVFVVISMLIGLARGEAGYSYNRPYPVQNVVNTRPHPGVRGHVHQAPQPQPNHHYSGYQQSSIQSHSANQVNSGYNSYAPPIVPQSFHSSPPKSFHNVGHLTSSQFIGAAPNKALSSGFDSSSIQSASNNFEHVGHNHLQQSGSATSVQAPTQQETVIKKHIYVHVPPPEPEPIRTQQHIAAAQPRKTYKIVFIKLPSYDAERANIVHQALNRIEEKTLIYVLAKSPEETQAEINQAYAQRNKPEVYFIKYKAQTTPTAQPSSGSVLHQNSFSEGVFNSGPVESAHPEQGSISLSNSLSSSSIGSSLGGESSGHQSSAGSLSVQGVSVSSSHSIPQPSPQYGPAHH